MNLGSRADGAFGWSGSIDEVAIYGSALDEATLVAHRANGLNAARTTPCDRRSVLRGASADWARLYVDGDLAPIDVRLRDRSRGGFCVYSGRALAPARRVRLVGRAFDVAGAVVNCLRFDRVYTVHVQRIAPPDAAAAPRSGRTTA